MCLLFVAPQASIFNRTNNIRGVVKKKMWPREVIVPGEKIRGVYRDSKGRYGIAVVKIWNSVPHVHKKTTEAYLPLSGALRIFAGVRGRVEVLDFSRGICIVKPKTIHWAQSIGREPAEVAVFSMPAWRASDHRVVDIFALRDRARKSKRAGKKETRSRRGT